MQLVKQQLLLLVSLNLIQNGITIFNLNCFNTIQNVTLICSSVLENKAERFCFVLTFCSSGKVKVAKSGTKWYVNGAYKHGGYERIGLKNVRVMSIIKAIAKLDGWLAVCHTHLITQIHMLLMKIKNSTVIILFQWGNFFSSRGMCTSFRSNSLTCVRRSIKPLWHIQSLFRLSIFCFSGAPRLYCASIYLPHTMTFFI